MLLLLSRGFLNFHNILVVVHMYDFHSQSIYKYLQYFTKFELSVLDEAHLLAWSTTCFQ